LSVLLPVRDAQATLASTVGEILEILPELTPCFELIVVDDGSTDATLEVADDLAARYPQIRAVRHAEPLGRPASVQTGLRHSSGDVVFLRDPECRLALDEVHKLWRAIDEHPFVLGRSDSQRRSRLSIARKPRDGEETLRMVDRRASRAERQSSEEQARLIASPAEQDGPWFEIEVHGRRAHRVDGPLAARTKGRSNVTVSRKAPSPSPTKTDGKPAGPKYLRRLRDFALGE